MPSISAATARSGGTAYTAGLKTFSRQFHIQSADLRDYEDLQIFHALPRMTSMSWSAAHILSDVGFSVAATFTFALPGQ
ncbi:hypothetical protein WJX75_008867 [Coccomyxa subellipsoidea]|uniref:Uncharacterized protein n=1 Tax=Coccomyxa subellipsoidea TaxID=248742 RepID=A0ABR2YLJ5_9CHLO